MVGMGAEMNAASELVEEAFRWLQDRYDSFSFYQERDLVWTIQNHLVAEIRRRGLDLRVWNNYQIFREGRRGESADLVLQAADGTIAVAVELKYEPSQARPGSRWIGWAAGTPPSHRVALLWSRWPTDKP